VLERERIQSIFDTKMEHLLGQLIASERWSAVQEQAERWLVLGTAHEPAYRALMLAHPSVIKRPVIEWPAGAVTVGVDVGRWRLP